MKGYVGIYIKTKKKKQEEDWDGNSGQSVSAELVGIDIVNTTIVSPSSVSQPPMIQSPDPQSNLQVSIHQGATHLPIENS